MSDNIIYRLANQKAIMETGGKDAVMVNTDVLHKRVCNLSQSELMTGNDSSTFGSVLTKSPNHIRSIYVSNT